MNKTHSLTHTRTHPLCNFQNQHTNQLRVISVRFSDVFHWSCLDERESALPNNTAPGGHTCPTCYDQIIPATNLISPVADVLRARLKKTSWGRDEFVGTTVTDHSNNKPTLDQTTSASASASSVSHTSSYAMKQNLVDGVSSGANKPHVHETPKDHSINIDTTSSSSYYQSKSEFSFVLERCYFECLLIIMDI